MYLPLDAAVNNNNSHLQKATRSDINQETMFRQGCSSFKLTDEKAAAKKRMKQTRRKTR
jgi:hypothetical protein